MAMKNPPHPGAGLKDDITALGITISSAAAAIGVSRQQLHNVTSGKGGVSPDMAQRLEKAIGSTARHWLQLQRSYNLAQARLRGDTKAVNRLARRLAEHEAASERREP